MFRYNRFIRPLACSLAALAVTTGLQINVNSNHPAALAQDLMPDTINANADNPSELTAIWNAQNNQARLRWETPEGAYAYWIYVINHTEQQKGWLLESIPGYRKTTTIRNLDDGMDYSFYLVAKRKNPSTFDALWSRYAGPARLDRRSKLPEVSVCDRTPAVQDLIEDKIRKNCTEVTRQC